MNTIDYICWGSARCGKSLNEELLIRKYIDEDIFPFWVFEVYKFLQKINLSACISYDSDKNDVVFHILHVPIELRKIVFEKAKELGLIFRIHKKQRAIYSGHPLLIPPEHRNVIGFDNESIEFLIREPRNGEDIEEIYYTLEREYL